MCVSAETVRQLEAGPEGVEIVVFGTPNTENRDVEMVPERWTDCSWIVAGPEAAGFPCGGVDGGAR